MITKNVIGIARVEWNKVFTTKDSQNSLSVSFSREAPGTKLFTLHAKILCTISELYARARQLADGPQTRKGTKDEYLYFLENKSVYSKALMCKEMKEDAKKTFDEKGEGYGVMLLYQGLFVTHLNECQKTIKKCGNLVDQVGFEQMLEEAKTEGQKMHDLNKRIYMQPVPKEEDGTFFFTVLALSCPQTVLGKTQGHYIVIKNLSQGTYLHFFQGQFADRTVRGQKKIGVRGRYRF